MHLIRLSQLEKACLKRAADILDPHLLCDFYYGRQAYSFISNKSPIRYRILNRVEKDLVKSIVSCKFILAAIASLPDFFSPTPRFGERGAGGEGLECTKTFG